MRISQFPPKNVWPKLAKRPLIYNDELKRSVEEIFSAVRQTGDEALRYYTQKFDGVVLESLEVSPSEIKRAEKFIDPQLSQSIQTARKNIDTFHRAQQETMSEIETSPGVLCWRKSIAIERVGLYIPGGTAPLFSSLLMLAIPAQIAGCPEIIVCTPPQKDGSVDPRILYCADILNLNKIYKVGGAQAIAAFTFGTSIISRVDKIFGPGNQYVTMAKQVAGVYGMAIDMPAGPSEVLVVADESADPEFVAADLLAQAEHGPDSQVLLVTNTEKIIPDVQSALQQQLQQLPRQAVAARALEQSHTLLFSDMIECVDFVNVYAPEHLILLVKDPRSIIDRITNAGSVFIGDYTPEAAGDYASGTNHTLPTNGFARSYSGVSLDSFVKKITFQEISRHGLEELGPTIETLADAENLQAHKNAVAIRRKKYKL